MRLAETDGVLAGRGVIIALKIGLRDGCTGDVDDDVEDADVGELWGGVWRDGTWRMRGTLEGGGR